MARARRFVIAGKSVRRGETRDVYIPISQRYNGDPITLPVRVIRAKKPGPCVCITAAVHGDEINGVGVIHELMFGTALELTAGTLVLVPVVNVFGFETQSRYMPDRRDLNRSFPGSETGSLTSRAAFTIFHEIIRKAQYGVDLHTAAVQRTNYPNVRGDLDDRNVRRVARSFGCELMLHGKGPVGSLRREACKRGCATITVEMGEPFKVEPRPLEVGVRGVHNVLRDLKMMPGDVIRPDYQVRINRAVWIRANVGGLLRFHVSPGQFVKRGQPIATNTSVFGEAQNTLVAPVEGVVLGMTTMPMVKPGEPVCHLAVPRRSMRSIRRQLAQSNGDSLHHQLVEDLATNLTIAEHEPEPVQESLAEES